MPEPSRDRRQTLLLAWSGADWQLLEPLLEAGDMPNLAGLIASGVIGHLAPTAPIEPAMSLTTAVTGVPGHCHGVLTAEQPVITDSFRPQLEPVTSGCRKVPALWDYLAAVGLSSGVINWPATYPAQEHIGAVVSDRFFHAGVLAAIQSHSHDHCDPGLIAPPTIADALIKLRIDPRSITRDQLRLFIPSVDQLDIKNDPRLPVLATLIARTMTIQNVATAIASEMCNALLAVRFDAPMLVCRHFMDYHAPPHPLVSDADAGHFGQIMPRVLKLLDQMLGVLLKVVGPDTDVVLCSDHGSFSTPLGEVYEPDAPEPGPAEGSRVRPPIEPSRPEQYQRADGLIVCAGHSFIGRDDPIAASLVDLAPTVLALQTVRQPAHMTGRVLMNVAEPDRWIDPPDPTLPDPKDRERIWDRAEIVADLIALGLVLAPSADISALKQIMHRRASARGMQAMQAQDYAQAADQLALALDYSDDFNAQVQLFRALVGSRRFDQARARLVQLEQLAPTSSVVESLRAAFYEAISTAGGAGV